ncbi:hypothetical protein TUBRATIS_000170 [Tubulinosema ratisbonensis]|uniref:Exocyst complex component Sec10 n=1 Tax=Tubulinosema ratisbonensis TaxID=291195 RepID=A0A437AQP3_9MICR|nr:hypothetical protein TUBRATIS_000170 [Tubulinosema ratisbonensis]
MKISINKIKNVTISSQTLLEEIFPKEMPLDQIEQSLKETLIGLQELEEALFFKQEKINTENMKFKEYDFQQLRLKQEIKFNESETLKQIVSLQNEYDNLVISERFLKFYKFIKNNLEMDFPTFLDRKIEEENFICFCLSEMENDIFIGNKARDFKEKMEKYLINKFEESLGHSFDLKYVYECSYFLNEGYPLLKIYANNIELFKSPYFIKKQEISLINLDNFKVQEDFRILLEKIKEIYKKEEKIIKEVFFDQKRVLSLINQRIFEDVIASNLDILLENNLPMLFVCNLEQSYILIQNVNLVFKETFTNFDNSVFISEVFSPFISLLSLKERSSFDEIFNYLIFKKELKSNYFILNDTLKPTNDIKQIFKILIFIFTKIVKRHELFFKNEEVEDYFDHFLRKFNEFINYVISILIEKDKMKTIDTISEFFLVIKQVLFSSQIHSVDILSDFFTEKVKKLFQERIIQSEIKIKKMFYEFSFTEYSKEYTDTVNKLITFLKEEISLCKQYLEGLNGIKFITLLMNSVYLSYYKKILTFKFGKESSTLLRDTKKLLNFCKIHVPDSVRNFEYLVEIVQLINISKNDIESYYSSVYEKIPNEEAKKILKCRIDYREIKHILYEK